MSAKFFRPQDFPTHLNPICHDLYLFLVNIPHSFLLTEPHSLLHSNPHSLPSLIMTTTELLSNLDALVLCCFSIFLLTAYLTTVELLRFRRMRNENAYFSSIYPDNASLGCMTNEDAHRITKYLMQYEFPFAFEVSLAASLYRPYGIPSISRVVCKTKQFADVHVASKRTADTAVLVVDMAQNPPESEKCCGAISRMNYIHGIYQRAGMIKDEDMLYTLALLALLPATFIGQHEWRDLTTVELCAAGVFWKSKSCETVPFAGHSH